MENNPCTLARAPWGKMRGALLGLFGRDAVEVFTPSSPGTPFSRGEKIQGKSNPRSSLIDQGRELGLLYWKQLKEETGRLVDEFRNSPFQSEVEQALDHVRALAEQGLLQAQEGVAQFRKDHQKDLEDALANLKKLRDRMRQQGDKSGAQRLDKQIEKVEEGIRP